MRIFCDCLYVLKPAPTTAPSSTIALLLLTIGIRRDLRKLSKVELTRLLINFGVKKEDISKLKRWDMVDLVRLRSTESAESSGSMFKELTSRYVCFGCFHTYYDMIL